MTGRIAGAALAAPAAILLLALLILPSAGVLVLSLTDYQFGMEGFDWVGLRNYGRLIRDDGIRGSLGNTFAYVAFVAPVSIGGALWVAILLTGQGRLRGAFQTVFFLPVTATLVAMATAWEVLLHPTFGMANAALSAMGFGEGALPVGPGHGAADAGGHRGLEAAGLQRAAVPGGAGDDPARPLRGRGDRRGGWRAGAASPW